MSGTNTSGARHRTWLVWTGPSAKSQLSPLSRGRSDMSGAWHQTCPEETCHEDAPAHGRGTRGEGRGLVVEHDAAATQRALEPDEAVPPAHVPLRLLAPHGDGRR